MIYFHTNHIQFSRNDEVLSIIIDDYELFDYIDDLLTEGIDDKVIKSIERNGSKMIIHCDQIFEDKIIRIITALKDDEIEKIYLLNNTYDSQPNKKP